MKRLGVQVPCRPSRSSATDWAFFVSGETRSASTRKGETAMANQTNGNQFRDDEIIIPDGLRGRDGDPRVTVRGSAIKSLRLHQPV
jgi:hypothetical protein